MAPSRFLDDFVPTIEDDEEDIPDYDEEEEAVAVPTTDRKRKRDSEAVDVTVTKPKKKKNKNKKNTPVEEEEDEEVPADNDAERGVDDGTMNPDFEFAVSKDQDGIVEGFGDWALSATSNVAMPTKALGIEEIIQRRRKQAEKDAPKKDDVDEEQEDEVDGVEVDVEDDELLADDAFGMGVAEEDEDDEEDHDEAADGEDSEEEQQDSKLKVPTESDEEEDDSEIAAPVPHPDDAMTDDEGPDEKEEDPEMAAKRAAFFAPEDGAPENQPLSTTSTSFQSMSLSRPILKGLAAVGFNTATPIQVKAVPVALMGKDVVGGAVTGSGKTAAFVIPILERLLYRPKKVPTTRVAILMPTRELAAQCFNVAMKLAQFTDVTFALIVGGLSLREQEQVLKKRPDVVIATPGRFIDHMRNTASFQVENLEILVLDEADRMLEDGFADELNEIITTIPKSRQTMLFSATMTEDLDKLIRVGMNRPARLMVNAKRETVKGLVQEFIKMKGATDDIEEDRRLAYLLHLCSNVYTQKTIIFCPRKDLAHRVKVLFAIHNLKAAELHGSMSQEQRLAAITSFREGECMHLLATDLASRGLDIPHVETVINFTVPTQTETYLHRVGRTARAGRSGVACTLFSASKSKTATKKQASERTLLKPILRIAKGQSAIIRTRNLPVDVINTLTDRVKADQEEIDAILAEEKEERLIQQTERDLTKGENLVKYEDEIQSRPRRTWFQNEKDKQSASEKGKVERLGLVNGDGASGKRDKKGPLSGKEKKQLEARDIRVGGGGSQGWKKGKAERAGGGVLAPQKKGKPSNDGKSKGKPSGDSKSKSKPRGESKSKGKSSGGKPQGHGKTR